MRFFFGVFLLAGTIFGERISIAVPCYNGHFVFLERLLEAYEQQTRVPDEVVVSLSGCELIEEGAVDALEERGWPFALKVVQHFGKRTEAENRTAACLEASGSVVITNDADDLPHRQRVEVIEYFMELYPHCKCLIHKWYEESWGFIEKEKVARVFLRHWNDFYQWDRTHSANIALRQGVAKKIRWVNLEGGIDRDFLIRCQRVFHKTMMIDAPLIQYRNELSSYNSGEALIR